MQPIKSIVSKYYKWIKIGLFDFFKINKFKKFKRLLLSDAKEEKNGFGKSEKRLLKACQNDPENCYRYKKVFFNVYKDIATVEVIPFAEELLEIEQDIDFAKVLSARYRQIGEYEKSRKLLLRLTDKPYNIDKLTSQSFNHAINGVNSSEEIQQIVTYLLKDFSSEEDKIYKYAFSFLKDSDYKELAINYGLRYFELNPLDKNFRNVLLKRLNNVKFEEQLKYVKHVLNDLKYIDKLKNGSIFQDGKFSSYNYKKDLTIVATKVTEPVISIYVNNVLKSFPSSKEQILKDTIGVLRNIKKDSALKYLEKLNVLSENIQPYNVDLFLKSKLLKQWEFDGVKFKDELRIFSNSSEKELKTYIQEIEKRFKKEKMFKIIFSELKDSHPKIAVEYGLKYVVNHKDEIAFIKPLIKRLERLGETEKLISLAKETLKYVEDIDLKYIILKERMLCDVVEFVKRDTTEDFRKLEEKYSDELFYLYRLIFENLKDINYEKAEYYANKALEIWHNEDLIINLYNLHINYGNLTKAREVIPENIKMPTLFTKLQDVDSFLDLYNNGFDLEVVNNSANYVPEESKVLYLLHNRLPYNSVGYATRSHGVLTGVHSFGWNIHGVSRLGYPCDKMPGKEFNVLDIVDGITYHTLMKDNVGLGKLPLKDYLIEYANEFLELAKKEKPAIIHAASNYMNGVVGNYVAKCLGIKSIYEVRGLWEITRISRQPEWKDTEYYNLMVKMETEAAKGADIVFTLTEALKDEMIARGVDGSKIIILPNGVSSERFLPLSRNKDLEKSLNLENKVVIGYIGSAVPYEGLEYLVGAVKLLVERDIKNISALVVGDGTVLDFIKDEVKKAELSEYFIFTGRVPHEDVEDYYSLVDITPFPRKGQPVCEMVSPLKPFEAMAMEKAVLSSNVNALKEIVKDGFNGLLFEKDNVVDLADKLEILINDNELRNLLGKNARKWIIENRDWKVISNILNAQYHNLLKGN